MFYDCVVCLVGPCNEVYGMLLLWILAGEAMSREREREKERGVHGREFLGGPCSEAHGHVPSY